MHNNHISRKIKLCKYTFFPKIKVHKYTFFPKTTIIIQYHFLLQKKFSVFQFLRFSDLKKYYFCRLLIL